MKWVGVILGEAFCWSWKQRQRHIFSCFSVPIFAYIWETYFRPFILQDMLHPLNISELIIACQISPWLMQARF
jgi:hypothetical protein